MFFVTFNESALNALPSWYVLKVVELTCPYPMLKNAHEFVWKIDTNARIYIYIYTLGSWYRAEGNIGHWLNVRLKWTYIIVKAVWRHRRWMEAWKKGWGRWYWHWCDSLNSIDKEISMLFVSPLAFQKRYLQRNTFILILLCCGNF